jgi:hypothetical protein
MSAALNALIANYQTKVDALTDTDTRLEAQWALETFSGAALAYEQAAPRGPVNYSIAGRSFEFPSKEDARQAMEDARNDLGGFLSATGSVSLIDFRSTW